MLTIATYNIQHFENEEQICSNIRQLIKNGCDVICLQECNHRDGFSRAKMLIDSLLPDGWSVEYFYDAKFGKVQGFASLWSNKCIYKNTQTLFLPENKTTDILRYIYTTTPSRRGALLITLTYQGRTICITNVHLDVKGGMGHRFAQLRYLRDTMAKNIWQHEIVCGDFNTIGLPYFIQMQKTKIQRILGGAFVNVHPKPIGTHDVFLSTEDALLTKHALAVLSFFRKAGFTFRQQLDYIFVRGFKVVKADLYEVPGSDHFPLQAHIEMIKPLDNKTHL